MASQRLTNHNRDRLFDKVVSPKFSALELALSEEWRAFANVVLDDIAGFLFKDKLEELPQYWFPQVICFNVQFGEAEVKHRKQLDLRQRKVDASFNVRIDYNESYSRRVPNYADKSGNTVKTYPIRHAFSKRYLELKERGKALGEQRKEEGAQIRRVLNSCTTVEKLRETWPELSALITEVCKASPPLPAVQDLRPQVRKLNKLFDLKAA